MFIKQLMLLLALLCFWPLAAQAQKQSETDSSQFIIINDLVLKGNKRTKAKIILRELSFDIGDTVYTQNPYAFFQAEANKVFNTDLFVTVDVLHKTATKGSPYVNVEVLMRERWYIYPSPIFELADRSFSEWWTNQNRDPKRLEYGFYFTHDNFRGRKEKLAMLFKFGFTKKIALGYEVPYINKKQTSGLKVKFQYAENKNVNFWSEGNKLGNYGSEQRLQKRWHAMASYYYRPSFYLTHSFDLSFNNYIMNDSISLLNPNYLGKGLNRLPYLETLYTFTYDKRDKRYYPLNGYYFRLSAQKFGLGILNTTLDAGALKFDFGKYWSLGGGFYYATRNIFRTSYPALPPYVISNGLGWGQEYVRGYDLYVVESQHHALSRNVLRRHLFSRVFKLNTLFKADQFNTIPMSMYLNVFSDFAYAHNPAIPERNRRLANSLMAGYGLGLDVVSFYDMVVRFEYVFTRHRENGFFINVEAGL